MGIIGFEGQQVKCIIGIHPRERSQEQNIFIDLQTMIDFESVAKTDNLENAVCYATLAEFCSEFARKGQFKMLETLAQELVYNLVDKFQLPWVKVTIKKPEALPTASFAFVSLEYGNRML